MDNIIDVLRSMPDFVGSNGRSEEEIELAETMLGVAFTRDYRNYLEKIGLACFNGHELTGLAKTERLNVVTVTEEQRERFGKNVSTWYVIEETNIYGIVIWQDTNGFVYETASNLKLKKVADSLAEYFTR